MRRTALRFLMVTMLALAGGLITVPAEASPGRHGHQRGPDVISLPNGFQPEGIAIGRRDAFYVGSLADGAIYRGSLRTGEGSVLVPGVTGRAIAGIEVDHQRIFAAGSRTGTAWVFDARTGAQLAEYQLAAPGTAFINDVVVTRTAAWFTDSLNQVLYKVPITRGKLAATAESLPLTGDFAVDADPATLELNGIEASPDGRTLLVVQSRTGLLFAVDTRTGVTTQVDLGGTVLTNGDGLLRKGSTLYVVQNRLNQIAEITLSRGYRSGTLVRTLTDPDFQVPTTVGAANGSLYAVNARFGTPPTPDTTYTVVRVSLR